MKYFTLFLTVLSSALIYESKSHAQLANGTSDVMRRFASDDQQVRSLARHDLSKERADLIKQLTAFIKDNAHSQRNFGKVKDVMGALGDIRATESMNVLLQHIGYPFTAEVDDSTDKVGITIFIDARLPATEALIAMGDQSVDPVIEKLSATDHPIETEACIIVLRHLRTRYIRERIVLLAESGINEQTKIRLNRALKIYDEWLPAAERTKRLLERLKELPLTPPTDK
jgi:hypothetical protein